MKYADVTLGQVEALINKLGGLAGMQRFLRGELVVSEAIVSQPITRRWQEQNGVITFTVTSDGTTGEGWLERLERKGLRVGDCAKQLLRSRKFQPTSGVTTTIAVLKGSLFTDDNRVTKKIRAEAKKRGFTTPNAEIACIIRDQFSDKEIEAMGLWWIVAMHLSIKDSDGTPFLLGVYRDDGGRWLYAFNGYPDRGWGEGCGFAFASAPTT